MGPIETKVTKLIEDSLIGTSLHHWFHGGGKGRPVRGDITKNVEALARLSAAQSEALGEIARQIDALGAARR